MKYYGIYKITNKVNGKMYIGQHITSNLDDGYMGSGAIMKKALKKYGEEAFTKEWLEFAENAEDLNYIERMYVDEEWLARPDTYNLRLGGEGGWEHIIKNKLNHTQSANLKIKNALKTPIDVYDESGNFLEHYDTMKEASIATNCHISKICSCCRGYIRKTKGFVFRYTNGIGQKRLNKGNN